METKEIQLRYKGFQCAVCGLSVEEMMSRFGTFNRMTEFHHIDPKSKSSNYENLIRRKISSEQLDELDKCVLLCSNCHGLVHAQNCNGTIIINVEIEGSNSKVSQSFDGQFIVDFIDKKIKFITDNKILLNQYHVRFGNEKYQNFLGLELNKDNFFLNQFKKLKKYKFIEVIDLKSNEILMQAKQIDNVNINLKQSLKFPFFNYDIINNSKSNQFLWVRNGLIFTKDKILQTEGIIEANIQLKREA